MPQSSGAASIAFKSLEGRIVRSFGSDPEDIKIHRCCGEWQRTKRMTPTQRAQLRATGSILPNLPRWRLADGINLSRFTPFPHQLIVSDLLATKWLGFAGFDGLSRTRALVADEGGTGKTLSASIAVRWACCQPGAEGAVIVLCPPLLKDHWRDHLRAVFDDDPDRVHVLSSAQWFDPNLHRSDIVVVSKFSWSKHWGEISQRLGHDDSSPPPLCVVVDEVHQGRKGFDDPDESMEGGVGGDQVDIQSLRRSIRWICSKARYAIGVTATPINIHSKEIVDILQLLGSEQTDLKEIPKDPLEPIQWMESLGKVSSWARGEEDPDSNCPKKLTDRLVKLLRGGEWPVDQWTQFDQSDAEVLADWLSEPGDAITPDLALTMCREMHPFGRHLCMTLREHLDPITAERFRTRWERAVRARPSDELMAFYNSVTRIGGEGDESHPGMDDGMSINTRMICSHRMNPESTVEEPGPKQGRPRYSGTWVPGAGLDWSNVRGIEDQRVAELTALIEGDIAEDGGDSDGRRSGARGCVVFTDWRGTVHWLREHDTGLPRMIDGVRLEVMELTGSSNLREAKAMLGRCETSSMSSRIYPVLICTAAGEVGLDMPWATLLVHWDLHPNPQRMEQRAWRLDRLIKPGEKISEEFTIVHMMLDGPPVFDKLEKTVNDRFDLACKSLGLSQRTYVPEGGDQVKISPQGSKSNSRLQSRDISHLDEFLRDEVSSTWPGRMLRESERLRTAVVLHMTGVIDDPSGVIDSGVVPVEDLWSKEIVFGNIPNSRLRDLESIHPSLSSGLSPGLSPSAGTARHCAWGVEDDDKGDTEIDRLVSARGALGRLFGPLGSGGESLDIPVVRLPEGTLPEDCTVALNRGLASMERELALDESGLRIIGRSGESYDPAEESHWDALFSACAKLVAEGPDGVQPAQQGMGEDSQGRESAENRIKVLERRNLQDEGHRDRIRAKIEESDEEMARILAEKADQLNGNIGSRAALIDLIGRLGHEMHPVMALEVGP